MQDHPFHHSFSRCLQCVIVFHIFHPLTDKYVHVEKSKELRPVVNKGGDFSRLEVNAYNFFSVLTLLVARQELRLIRKKTVPLILFILFRNKQMKKTEEGQM